MSSNSKTAVTAAIIGNAGLTVLKFGAAVVSHSPSMMNEAIHSLMDTANQLFLLLGLRAAARGADQLYAFGHGQKNICGIYGARSDCSRLAAVLDWRTRGIVGPAWRMQVR